MLTTINAILLRQLLTTCRKRLLRTNVWKQVHEEEEEEDKLNNYFNNCDGVSIVIGAKTSHQLRHKNNLFIVWRDTLR